LLNVVLVLMLAISISTQVQNRESLLSAAGFQTRIPSTQAQWASYNQMTPYKLERNSMGPKDPLLAPWVSQKELLEQNAA
jgi:hypothetical protein